MGWRHRWQGKGSDIGLRLEMWIWRIRSVDKISNEEVIKGPRRVKYFSGYKEEKGKLDCTHPESKWGIVLTMVFGASLEGEKKI